MIFDNFLIILKTFWLLGTNHMVLDQNAQVGHLFLKLRCDRTYAKTCQNGPNFVHCDLKQKKILINM
jgi:hypothetical protein